MKNLLYLCGLLFLSQMTKAQEFTLEPIPSVVEGPAVQQPLLAFAEIVNQTYDSKVVIWERLSEDIPVGWDSGVCTSLGCFLSDVSEGEFPMIPLESLHVDLQFNTNGIPGHGRVEVKIYFEGDSANYVVGIYEADATAVSVENVEAERSILVYPNPCGNYCYISNRIENSSYEIYSILGTVVKRNFYNGKPIFVGDLNPGLYYISLLDGESRATVPFVKS